MENCYGGGIYCSGGAVVIRGCTISGNESFHGGGVCGSASRISDCNITGNWAHGGTPTAEGGGILNCSGIIENCVISGNFTEAGFTTGGSGLCGCNGQIVNCLIINNSGWGDLGGCYGGGLYLCDGQIRNCTIYGNSDSAGAGIYQCYGLIANCIIWGNHTAWNEWRNSTPTYSCIENWTGGGTGNLALDPVFVNGPLGGYYLSQVAAGQALDSPCVDAGSDLAVNLGMGELTTRTDHVGDTGTVDMGYHYAIPNPADIEGDGGVDWTDYVILASQWQGLPGVPSADIAPPGGDGVVDGKDLGMLGRNWLWGK